MHTSFIASAFALAAAVSAAPLTKRWDYSKYFDLEGHRGARGEAIESTLPAFGQAIIHGATTLELDFGVTKDGHAIVWHDESIQADKCLDTAPAFENDPLFPYVGRYVNTLTLEQIKTLDCGSLRLDGFPLQYLVPGQKISTLDELFDFVDCATANPILYNIESKINAENETLTFRPAEFMDVFLPILQARGKEFVDRITHQSFAWESIIVSKERLPSLRTSALCDDTTIWPYPEGETSGNLTVHGQGPAPWLNGLDIDTFEGETVGERVARAAASVGADVLSPVATSYASESPDPALPGWIPFTNKTMVDTARSLGLETRPWTPNYLNLIEYLISEAGVSGLITDFPENVRRYLINEHPELPLAPKQDPKPVKQCLAKHNQRHNVTSA
ncbi:hypothetical protein JCM11251_000971 [Rhodosporidiobolus azoricus]